MNIIKIIVILLVIFFLSPNYLLADTISKTQNEDIPKEFKPLYNELEQQISIAENKVSLLKQEKISSPLISPSLYLVSSYFGPIEKDSKKWNELITTLDGFQRLGIKSVSFMISFPNLTIEVDKINALVDSYKRIIFEIKRRNMKVLIEHFVYPPITSTKDGEFISYIKNLNEPKKTFLKLKKEEIEIIVSEIKPDYLSIISEPETYNKFLGLKISATDYKEWLKEVLEEIYILDKLKNTKIGAGSGIWESDEYINSFLEVNKLDFIDIHFYPLKLESEDMISKFLATIDKIKAKNSSKKIIISEFWLYKHSAYEGKGVYNADAYGRNVYDFWQPLDIRFLNLINNIAKNKGIDVIAPYFSQYLFYNEKFNSSIKQKKWPMSMIEEWDKAIGNMKLNQLSKIGSFFRTLEEKNNNKID